MAIEHLIKGHSAQRQKAQITDRQSKTLDTTMASSICLERPRLVPDVMAIDIINANYAPLKEDGVSRAHIRCWPLLLRAAPIWGTINYLLNMSIIPGHLLPSFLLKIKGSWCLPPSNRYKIGGNFRTGKGNKRKSPFSNFMFGITNILVLEMW